MGSHRMIRMIRVGLRYTSSRASLIVSFTILPYTALVGGIATPLKNMKVNWDDYSQYMAYGQIKNVPNHQPVQYLANFEDPKKEPIPSSHPILLHPHLVSCFLGPWSITSPSPAYDPSWSFLDQIPSPSRSCWWSAWVAAPEFARGPGELFRTQVAMTQNETWRTYEN